MELAIIISAVIAIALVVLFTKDKGQKLNISMAEGKEYPKFTIRYRNIVKGDRLHTAGLRNGQYGIIVKHADRMYARVYVTKRAKYIPITSQFYTPTSDCL